MQLNLPAMSASVQAIALVFPRPVAPSPGDISEIAPGILWLRLALPFQLNHVNIYLLEDGPGWAVLDTGVGDLRTRAVWEHVLVDHLRGRKLTRVIVTHYHPDHVGLAGWFTESLGLELYMSQVEYLMSLHLQHKPATHGDAAHGDFYRQHGLNAETIAAVTGRGHAYLKLTTGLPPTYHRLVAGEQLDIGGRRFDILTGGGHAPEQVMLLCRDEGIFLAADQVLARISPNVSVWPGEPNSDPLGDYLTSLAALRRVVPEDVFVLPAHNLPFYGLHLRIAELEEHHERRCAEIADACAIPRTTADLVPILFPRALDPHQMGFAFGEVHAHINLMLRRGALAADEDSHGIRRVTKNG
jgi:glyoxylase-like metal-dependent hydrolase (beta-lactamase superfamily II)